MPKETFWNSATAVEDDGTSEPVLTVTWGDDYTGVFLNGVHFDESAIKRLTAVLNRANGKDRTVNITLVAHTDDYIAGMERAAAATRELADVAEQLKAAGIPTANIADAVRASQLLSR